MPDNRIVVNHGIGFKTEWEITLIDAKTGKVRQHLPWHKNTILDTGLNYRLNQSSPFGTGGAATYTPVLFGHIAVGSGNTAPSTTDVGLETLVSTKAAVASLGLFSNADPAAPYFIIGTQFGTAEANGDLKEVGLTSAASSGTYWSRNLFVDGNGDPITITKTTSDLLTVKCKTTISRASESAYSSVLGDYTIAGMITNRGLYYTANGEQNYNWWIGHALIGTSNTAPSSAQTGLLGTQLLDGSPTWSAAHSGPTDGFYKEATVSILSYQANGEIGEVVLSVGSTSGGTYVMQSRHTFTPVIVKDETKQLDLTFRVTLTRS